VQPGMVPAGWQLAGLHAVESFRLASLRNPDNLANLLLARVLENDLITKDRREQIVDSLLSITRRGQGEGAVADAPVEQTHRSRIVSSYGSILVGLTVGSAIIGTLTFALTTKGSSTYTSWTTGPFFVLTIAVVTVVAVIAVWTSTRSDPNRKRLGDRRRAEELRTYPAEDQVRNALKKLTTLTPNAVGSLRTHFTNAVNSAENGDPAGLYTRSGGTPWGQELKRCGLLVPIDPPSDAGPSRGREFLVLTTEGELLGRVLGASKGAIPQALMELYATDASSTSSPVVVAMAPAANETADQASASNGSTS
jgi:hypothetical protein